MSFYYFTRPNTYIFNSLKRYFKYVSSQSLICISTNFSLDDNDLLFILCEEKDDNELINFLVDNPEIKVITFGFNDNSSIDIIDLCNLKNSIQRIIRGNFENVKPLFTNEEIKEKLKNLFHSHGEDSLFEYLNWTVYYLREGPIQFLTKNISYSDYEEKFLAVGLKNWNLFKSRYLKYRYFIKHSNIYSSFEELETAINEADLYINNLSKMNEEKILEKNENFFYENIAKVQNISDILVVIYKDFQLGKTSL